MVTASSSPSSLNPNNNRGSGEFTTLKERVTIEKEIKKSKFIAIAGSVSDERSTVSFLFEWVSFDLLNGKESQDFILFSFSIWWALGIQVGDQYRSNEMVNHLVQLASQYILQLSLLAWIELWLSLSDGIFSFLYPNFQNWKKKM